MAGKRFIVPQAFVNEVAEGGVSNLAQGAMDIAVFELAQPIRPLGIHPAIVYSGNDEMGKTATYVGYGTRGTHLTVADDKRFGAGGWGKPLRALAFTNVHRWCSVQGLSTRFYFAHG